jgi:hypothetical protein
MRRHQKTYTFFLRTPSLSFLVGSSVDSHFIFHTTLIILVQTFINIPFISSRISAKHHVCGSQFHTFQSVWSVFVFFNTFSLFISFQKNRQMRRWGDIKSVPFFYPWYLSALSCVILSKELQTERVRVTLWVNSGSLDKACNETPNCVRCHSDVPENTCQVIKPICHGYQ